MFLAVEPKIIIKRQICSFAWKSKENIIMLVDDLFRHNVRYQLRFPKSEFII